MYEIYTRLAFVFDICTLLLSLDYRLVITRTGCFPRLVFGSEKNIMEMNLSGMLARKKPQMFLMVVL